MHRVAPLFVDLVLIVAFAALGRRAHDEGAVLTGTLTVAAPFLIGYVIAATALRLDRNAFGIRRAIGVWALAVALGLLLRGTVFDRGLAPAFVVVAVTTLGAFLVGWRLLYRFAGRRGRRGSARADPAGASGEGGI